MRRKENLHYRGYDVGSYLLHYSCPRFGTGEGKVVINESVRSTDVSTMVGVMSYSIPYTASGYINHMSPDDRFQNLKRIIGACSVIVHRVNVIMSSLYESRQHRRSKCESLDCAAALGELIVLGVKNIITFDAHGPRVQNVIPLIGLDNLTPTCQLVKALFSRDSNVRAGKRHLMIISLDEGAMDCIIYSANSLGVDMGMFYERRDRPQVIGGRNPAATHELLGSSVKGKTTLTIDDMVSSDESMLDTCKELKKHKTDKVIVCYTFSSLVNGLEKFDGYYHQGYLDYAITTNLNYRIQELIDREWYPEADMSKYLAVVINSMNHDRSISTSLSPTEKVQKLV